MGDLLHWTFDDTRFVNEIFPSGFSHADSTLPEDAFDPSGQWESAYDIVQTGYPELTDRPFSTYYGQLVIKRRPIPHDRVHFEVITCIHMGQTADGEVQVTRANFVCNCDPLTTLGWVADDGEGWHVASETTNLHDRAVAHLARYEEWGRIRAGEGRTCTIEKSVDGRHYRVFAKEPRAIDLTTNWSLLDAIQRLGWREKRTESLSFNMLHNLDTLHRDHRVGFLENFEAQFGGRSVDLHGYYHLGEGIMPSFYWVTDANRLVIARYGMTAYVFTNRNARDGRDG